MNGTLKAGRGGGRVSVPVPPTPPRARQRLTLRTPIMFTARHIQERAKRPTPPAL
jgi:hypothetical protein